MALERTRDEHPAFPEPTSPTCPDASSDLELAKNIAAHCMAEFAGDGRDGLRKGAASIGLVAELVAHILITYWLVFFVQPVWLKIALLVPYALFSTFCVDSIIHNLNHWPAFRSPVLNALVRALFIPLFCSPLEIWHNHREHHFSRDAGKPTDTRDVLDSPGVAGAKIYLFVARQTWLSLAGAMPWSPLPAVQHRVSRRDKMEIAATRTASWLLLGALLWFDPVDTLLFFVPCVFIASRVGSEVINLTDHIPGNWNEPFLQATWLEPANGWQRFLAKVNRSTASTHLTHHLFPSVHWIDLNRLQSALAPIYRRQKAPASLFVNSIILGNWFALLVVLRNVERACLRPEQ
jgi:fatty acid desaturase